MNVRFFFAVVASALVSSSVSAVSLTWDSDPTTGGAQDGSGTWDSVSTNWWDGANNTNWTSANPDSAIFGNGGTGGVVSLAGPIWAGGLTFAVLTNVPSYTNNYFISSNTLTLASGAVIALTAFTASTNSITTNSIANATIVLMKRCAASARPCWRRATPPPRCWNRAV